MDSAIQVKTPNTVHSVLISKDDEEKFSGLRFYIDSNGYPVAFHPEERWHKKFRDLVKGKAPADHSILCVSGDKLDCRRDNLKFVTKQQHRMHRDKNSNNTSGFLGLSYNRSKSRWVATIGKNRKTIDVGCFSTAEEAARARDQYLLEHTAEADRPFLRLNFPIENRA